MDIRHAGGLPALYWEGFDQMPLDGLTLGFIARELKQKLVGGRVDRVLQPENDEIHLLIRSLGENQRLLLCAGANAARVHLTEHAKQNPQEPPMLCMLLRKHLQGGRVTDVRRIGGDRILEIDIENIDELGENVTRTLVCELMGRHSNIILHMPDGKIVDSVRHVDESISRVRQILPGLIYTYPPAQDKLDPDACTAEAIAAALAQTPGRLDKAIQSALRGVSPQAARELSFRVSGGEGAYTQDIQLDTAARRLRSLLDDMPLWGPPTLLLDEDGAPADVFPYPQLCREGEKVRAVEAGISAALDQFYYERDRADRMRQRSQTLHKTLKTHIERCEKKLAIQIEALDNAARMDEYRKFGELIQANLYRLKKGMKTAEVEDFYEPDAPGISIPLDVRYTPAQNAQRYFKLYQKARSARQMAAEQKEKTEAELRFLEQQLDDLRKCTQPQELSEMRELLVASGHVKPVKSRVKPRKAEPSQPFHYISSEGIDIFVGKNSLQNERLTMSARGEDTWLHAKNMPGSHVIIRETHFGEQTLMEAAMLAAYYSKGQQSAQVPIDYTLRRYVKKPGGSPTGFVIYVNQKTLYITPDEHAVRRMKLAE